MELFDLAEASVEEVEVDEGAGEGESVPHDPLFAGLAHEETADALSDGIFTARIFSEMALPSRMRLPTT